MVSEELRLRSVAHRKLNPPNHLVREHGRRDPLSCSLQMTASPASISVAACERPKLCPDSSPAETMRWDSRGFFVCFVTYLFWLCWVFVAGCRLSLLAVNGVGSSLPCAGFSGWGAWALWAWALGAAASSLSSRDAWAQLLYGMWNLPRPEVEPVSLVSAGELLTTGPPKESQ